MARQIFPDEGSRLVFRATGSGRPLLSAAGGIATVYLDEAATQLADIQSFAGDPIPSSTLLVSSNSQMPLFRGPDGVDTLWARVDGGPVSPVYSRADDRLDTLVADVATALAGIATAQAAATAAAASAQAALDALSGIGAGEARQLEIFLWDADSSDFVPAGTGVNAPQLGMGGPEGAFASSAVFDEQRNGHAEIATT